MKKNFFILLLIIGVINTGSNCNNDTDAPFIPDITGNWVKQGNPNDNFIFTDPNIGTNNGNFTGFNDDNVNFDEFTGFYKNRNIEFTFDPGSSKQGQRYYGTIKGNSETMELTIPGGTKIILIHQ